MKMVVAIIRPERLPCVQQALQTTHAELMTVTETHCYGPTDGHTLIYRSAAIRIRSSPKLRVEILTDDMDAEDVAEALRHAEVSGHDGRILVLALDQCVDLSHESVLAGAR